MGWWSQTREGSSFSSDDPADQNFVWGDWTADVFDDALGKIVKAFEEDCNRKPSKAEIRAGLEFSLAVMELPE